jgi:hypothetical protein
VVQLPARQPVGHRDERLVLRQLIDAPDAPQCLPPLVLGQGICSRRDRRESAQLVLDPLGAVFGKAVDRRQQLVEHPEEFALR